MGREGSGTAGSGAKMTIAAGWFSCLNFFLGGVGGAWFFLLNERGFYCVVFFSLMERCGGRLHCL